MIVLKVLLAIMAALLLLTLVNIKAKITVVKSNIVLKVYYGVIGITVVGFTRPETKKKPKKKKPPKEEPAEEPEEPKELEKKLTFEQQIKQIEGYIDLIKRFLQPSKKALGTIINHFKIVGVTTDITVGGTDAHKTAINYSKHIIAITNALNILGRMFKVKIKRIKLQPDFLSEQSTYNAQALVKIRVIWLLVAVLYIAIALVKNIKNILREIRKKQTKKKVV